MDSTLLWSRDGVLVIGIAAVLPRAEARQRIRAAVREAAARWRKMDIELISVTSAPGQAPQLLLADRAAALSFSHEEGLSLAAIGLHGPVGIDVMRVQDLTEWENLARDYLGPQVVQELAACPAALRPAALARAWTAREAALKYSGQELAEWQGATPACRLQALPLPAPYLASLAY